MRRALVMLLAVARKELQQTLRDRRMMGMLLVAPAIQLFVFGNAANLDVDRVPTAIVDLDATTASRTHLRRLLADGTLRASQRLDDAEGAGAALVAGEASVGLVIPEGYARALARGRAGEPAHVQVLVDGSDPNRGAVATAAASRFFAEVATETLTDRAARAGLAAQGMVRGPISLRSRVLYNPELETAVNIVPGIATMLLLIITTIVTSMGLTRERETGTLEQILVTPVRPWALLAGKMLPFAAIGLFDFALALLVGSIVFHVPIHGSLPLLFAATATYLVTTLSMGLLISTVSATQQQAFLLGFLFMVPASLLSGIMTPVRSMPAWMQPFTLVNPLRHYADLLRAVLLRGAGVDEVLPQWLALALFGVVLATLAARRFQKSME